MTRRTIPIVLTEVGWFALMWGLSIVAAIFFAPLALALYLIESVHGKVFAPLDIGSLGAVVVTGGANGIGRAVVLQLIETGVTTVVVDIDSEQLRSLPPSKFLTTVTADITLGGDMERLREVVQALGKPLYAIFNNAGVHHCFECASALSDPAIQRTFDVNVFGAMRVIRVLYPLLMKPGGRILNMGSVGGLIGSPYLGVYSASKFALQGYTETLRREVCKDGVSVTILNPYFVHTRAHDPLFQSSVQSLPSDFSRLQMSLEYLQDRFMTADEVVPHVMTALTRRWAKDSVTLAYPLDKAMLWIISRTPNWCGAQDFLILHLQSSFLYEYLKVSTAEGSMGAQKRKNT